MSLRVGEPLSWTRTESDKRDGGPGLSPAFWTCYLAAQPGRTRCCTLHFNAANMPSLPLLTAVAASEEGRLADAKRRKSKSRTQTYIDSMELEAEGERPFRRSRTGCLTW
jgi:hypothetical protein